MCLNKFWKGTIKETISKRSKSNGIFCDCNCDCVDTRTFGRERSHLSLASHNFLCFGLSTSARSCWVSKVTCHTTHTHTYTHCEFSLWILASLNQFVAVGNTKDFSFAIAFVVVVVKPLIFLYCCCLTKKFNEFCFSRCLVVVLIRSLHLQESFDSVFLLLQNCILYCSMHAPYTAVFHFIWIWISV